MVQFLLFDPLRVIALVRPTKTTFQSDFPSCIYLRKYISLQVPRACSTRNKSVVRSSHDLSLFVSLIIVKNFQGALTLYFVFEASARMYKLGCCSLISELCRSGCCHLYAGSLQLLLSEKAGFTLSFPHILFPARFGCFLKQSFRSQ